MKLSYISIGGADYGETKVGHFGIGLCWLYVSWRGNRISFRQYTNGVAVGNGRRIFGDGGNKIIWKIKSKALRAL
jgi:hypothetical protein